MNRLVPTLLLTLVFLVLNAGIPGAVIAQDIEGEETAVADSSGTDDPTVLSQIEQDSDTLQALRETIGRDLQIEMIDAGLPGFKADVDTLIAEFENLPDIRLSIRDLDLVQRTWNSLDETATAWNSVIHARMDELETKQGKLADIHSTWELLTESDAADELEFVRQKVESLVENSDSLAANLLGRIDELFRLSRDLDLERDRLSGLDKILQIKLEAVRSNILTRDGELLPFMLFSDDVEESFVGQLAGAVDRDIAALRRYYVESLERFWLIIASFLVWLFITLAVRRVSKSWDRSENTMLALFVVASRPFSTALLLTLFVAALLLADSPPVIRDVIRLVALFPMMRLLPGMIPQTYRTSFYVFLGLLLSQYSHVLFRIGSGAERSALLVASVGVSVILGRLIFDNAERTGRRKTVLIRGSVLLMFGAFLLLIAASLANIVGYGVMAKVLGDGGLASIYSALAIYAVVRILEGLWSLFISSRTAHGLRAVHDHSAVILNRGRFVIRASLFVWWLSNTPSRFGLEYLSTSWTIALLQQSFKVGALSINVSNILAFVLTLWGAILISRFVRFILETDVFPRSGTPQGMRSATSTLTNYVLLSIGLLAALSAAGVNYESVALLAGAFGIGIGFGLQTIVNNFVSGLILIFERPIQVGDVIEFTGPGGNQMAQVSRIGIRSSVVRKFDGAEVILPNSTLVSNAVTNWTKTDKRRRIELLIHVALDTNPKEVLDILHRVAAENPGILKDPAPLALFREFGTHSLDFSLWAWTADFDIGLSLKSEMAVVLHESLKEAGIEIAIPARKISFESGADQASIRTIVPETGSEETPEIR